MRIRRALSRSLRYSMLLAVGLGLSWRLEARPPHDNQESQKIQQLEARITQLEQTVAQLKTIVESTNAVAATPPGPATRPAPAPAQTPEASQKSRFEMPP